MPPYEPADSSLASSSSSAAAARTDSSSANSNLQKLSATALSFVTKCREFVDSPTKSSSLTLTASPSFPSLLLKLSSPSVSPLRIAEVYKELGVWLFNSGEFSKCVPIMKNASAMYKISKIPHEEQKCRIIKLKAQLKLARTADEFSSLLSEFDGFRAAVEGEIRILFFTEFGTAKIQFGEFLNGLGNAKGMAHSCTSKESKENKETESLLGNELIVEGMKLFTEIDTKTMKIDKFNSLLDSLLRSVSYFRLFGLPEFQYSAASTFRLFVGNAMAARNLASDRLMNIKFSYATALEANSLFSAGKLTMAMLKYQEAFSQLSSLRRAELFTEIFVETPYQWSAIPFPIDFHSDPIESQLIYFDFINFLCSSHLHSHFQPFIAHCRRSFNSILTRIEQKQQAAETEEKSRSPDYYHFLFSIHYSLSNIFTCIDSPRISLGFSHALAGHKEITRLFRALVKASATEEKTTEQKSSQETHQHNHTQNQSQSLDEIEFSLIQQKYQKPALSTVRSESKSNFAILFDFLSSLSSIGTIYERIGHFSESRDYLSILEVVSDSIGTLEFTFAARLQKLKLTSRAKKCVDFNREFTKIKDEIEEFAMKSGRKVEFPLVSIRVSAAIDGGDHFRLTGEWKNSMENYKSAIQILSETTAGENQMREQLREMASGRIQSLKVQSAEASVSSAVLSEIDLLSLSHPQLDRRQQFWSSYWMGKLEIVKAKLLSMQTKPAGRGKKAKEISVGEADFLSPTALEFAFQSLCSIFPLQIPRCLRFASDFVFQFSGPLDFTHSAFTANISIAATARQQLIQARLQKIKHKELERIQSGYKENSEIKAAEEKPKETKKKKNKKNVDEIENLISSVAGISIDEPPSDAFRSFEFLDYSLEPELEFDRFKSSFLDLLPASWTAASLSLSADRKYLFLTRMRTSPAIPLIVKIPIPIDSAGGKEGNLVAEEKMKIKKPALKARSEAKRAIAIAADIDESSNSVSENSFHRCLSDFSSILLSSKACDIEGGNLNSASPKSAKESWWKKREQLDGRMKLLLQNMENNVLGPWKILLGGQIKSVELRNQLNSAADLLMEQFKISVEGEQAEFAKEILIAVMANIHLLNENQVRAAIAFAIGLTKEPRTQIDSDTIQSLFAVETRLSAFIRLCESVANRGRTALMLSDVSVSAGSADTSLSAVDCGPTILLLGGEFTSFPWENIRTLRFQSVTRMPNWMFIAESLRKVSQSKTMKLSADGVLSGLRIEKTRYCLNPSGELLSTEERFLAKFRANEQWSGVVREKPSAEKYRELLESSELFIYCGHNSGGQYLGSKELLAMEINCAALLMGCSSGKLTGETEADYEPFGIIIAYLIAGAPAILANLWDVTDGEIDRFCNSALSSIGNGVSLDKIVPKARESCKLRFLMGSAPVYYGIPIEIQGKYKQS